MTSDNAALIARLRTWKAGLRDDKMIPEAVGLIAEAASALEAAERRIKELEVDMEEAGKRVNWSLACSQPLAQAFDQTLDASAAEAVALRAGTQRALDIGNGAEIPGNISRSDAVISALEAALSLTPSAAAQRVRDVVIAGREYKRLLRAANEWRRAEADAGRLGIIYDAEHDYPVAKAGDELLHAIAALDHPEAGKDAT